jgi:perosamine synthetase
VSTTSRIPVLPVAAGGDLLGGRRSTIPSVLDVGRPLLVSSGAEAIRGALLHAAIGPGHEVLVPAFNCPSMVTPVHAVGATPVFFDITEDLRIDPSTIETRLGPRARAVLAPHFFAHLQDMRPLRELCEARRVVLIEDCAHALFGVTPGGVVGATGHYAIASPRKFLPLWEGGLLTSAIHDLAGLPVRSPAAHRAVRIAFDVTDLAAGHGRLRLAGPFLAAAKALRRAAGSLRAGPAPVGPPSHPEPTPTGTGNAPLQGASWLTAVMLRRLMTGKSVAARRANFHALLAPLRDATGLRVLDIDGIDGPHAVPYMLPILLSQPDRQLARLKATGIPIWRWEYSALGTGKVTDWYAAALIQIPCHQSLRRDELARLADALAAVATGG